MTQRRFIIELAGEQIVCQFLNDGVEQYFTGYCRNGGKEFPKVIMKKEYFKEKRKLLSEQEMDDATLEFNILINPISDELLKYQRCLFHGLAFVWNNKAYIFTAPSGTGKTTQYIMWKRKFEDEIQILNGDKPVLELCENGTAAVHPSPWNGKERMSGHQKAPLAGIILLRQGKENKIRKMTPKEAVLPLLRQFFFTTERVETVHRVCQFEENLLNRIPVWELTNRGDEESVQLTYDTLSEYERELQ